jgi:hypothetical protein
MNIKDFGLDKITEIYNIYDMLIDDDIIDKHPLLKFRINNLFIYFNNICSEFEDISQDYNNDTSEEYIKYELDKMIKLEEYLENL